MFNPADTMAGGSRAPAKPLVSDWLRVGGGFSVRFTLRPDGSGAVSLGAEWHPCVPGPGAGLNLDRYRAARDDFLKAVSAAIGGNAAVVEV